MKIINLTPHPLVLGDEKQRIETDPLFFQGYGRCEESWESQSQGIITGHRYHSPKLPQPQPETLFCVSLPTYLAARERKDLVLALGQIRDEMGRIVACSGVGRTER